MQAAATADQGGVTDQADAAGGGRDEKEDHDGEHGHGEEDDGHNHPHPERPARQNHRNMIQSWVKV